MCVRERARLMQVYLGDSNNPSLAVKILNGTPRPFLPSQTDWLEMASDNHSRIFTTLLFFSLFFVYCVCPKPSYKHSFARRGLRRREREGER